MFSYVNAGILIALVIAGYFFFRKKKNVDKYGPLFLTHTKRFLTFIDNMANLSPRFWKVLSTFGMFFGFVWMLLITTSVILNAKNLFLRPEAATKAVMMIIPGITTPLVGGIVGIIIMAIVHEFSHGIIARVEKIKVDSVGAVFLGFIPLGAFVKPNNKQLKKSRPLTRLRIYQAGSFANIVLAILLILLTAFVVLPWAIQPLNGVKLIGIVEGGPAEGAGLEAGMLLTSMNGESINDLADLALIFRKTSLEPGDTVELGTGEKTFSMIAEDAGGRGHIGISFCGQIPGKDLAIGTIFNPMLIKNINPACYPLKYPAASPVFWYLFKVLAWVIILNMGVGIFNLLPIKPLDGGYMIEAVLDKFFKKKWVSKIVITTSIVFFLITLLNFIGPRFL